MKIERSPAPHPALMFIAPSLDVVLALVFFIVLSTSFLLQPGVAVTVPDSPFLLAPQRDPLVVSLVAAPSEAVYFENEQVSLEELRSRLERRSTRNNTIIVKSDRRAPVEHLARVMNVTLALGYPTVIATSSDE